MDKPSRTQKKRAVEELQKIGERLVALDDAQLQGLDLPETLKTAVTDARRFTSHGARRRQFQYIGRLMRDYDADMVRNALEKLAARESEKRRRFKQVERWRDELIAGEPGRLQWLVETFPDIDRDQILSLVACAQGISTAMNAKEAARKLFRLLNEL